jgi:GntR family transcriptional regulator
MGSTTDPVYLRVLADLRAQIRDGALAPGARVPSRNGIIARYGVGETAAKHALAVLAAEGLIETRAGSGSYVRAAPAPCHLEHDRPHFPGSPFGLAGAVADGNGAGPGPGGEAGTTTVVSWEHQTGVARPPRHIARRLRLGPDEQATRTRYLLTCDGSPVQLAVSYERGHLTAPAPPPEAGPFAGRGVIERMRAIGVEVDEVTEDISVRPGTAEEAAALAIPAGAATLVVHREHRVAGRAVEVSEIVIAADRFQLRYRFGVPADRGGQPVAAGDASEVEHEHAR